MSRMVYRISRAAKQYTCTEHSYHRIEIGALYLYGACPPEHEANGTKKWWIIKACLRCAEQYALHSSDTRKQLAEKLQ